MLRKGLLLAFVAGMASTAFTAAIAQQFSGTLFPDVRQQDYFYDSVNRFSRKGIIKGYDNGLFAPYDYVTRGQVAVVVDRYDQLVISNLRKQVEYMRSELGLGVCGDGTVQIGEQCDDGNTTGGDGCSAECLQEIHCAGGYKVGDRYPAPDGCNICTCTEAGVACTQQACTQKKCFSSEECTQTQVCSVEQGDCRFPCPAGAVCVQACAGVCIPKAFDSVCGDGVCDGGETAVPNRTGDALYCPQDCEVAGPVCGDAQCDSGEADEYTIGASGPQLLRRGTCPQDCEGGTSSCDQQKRSVDQQFANSLACQSDDDCTVFVRGCSPYLTCGKAVNKNALEKVSSAVMQYADACVGSEAQLCAGCLPKTAACRNGFCELVD